MKIEKIKEEDLNLPPAPAAAPQIDWGQDFLNWDIEHQNRYLKRLCSALNHATDLIQKERNDLLVQLHEMKAILENADKNVANQKQIMVTALTNHNLEKQQLIKHLQELEVKVKSLSAKLQKYED